ncbi:MAG: L-threonylcarbamoyladenylate synthase [Patescibacteria group bacterium]
MQKQIDQAVGILKQGGIVIYPTDTAYAIGCKFKNRTGINKILRIKKRKDKKFTLIASSLYQVEKFFKLNSCQRKIAKKYWPGPVSIVVSNNFSVRVPKNNIARQLAKSAGEPIIATSLNISGEATIYNLEKIQYTALQKKINHEQIEIVDSGSLTKRKPSAIIQCFTNNKIKILRHGPIHISAEQFFTK